jgi:hypothetical protein
MAAHPINRQLEIRFTRNAVLVGFIIVQAFWNFTIAVVPKRRELEAFFATQTEGKVSTVILTVINLLEASVGFGQEGALRAPETCRRGLSTVIKNAEGNLLNDGRAKVVSVKNELFDASNAFAKRVDFSAITVNVRDADIARKVKEPTIVADQTFACDAVETAGAAGLRLRVGQEDGPEEE